MDDRARPRDRALTVYWEGDEVPGALLYGLRQPGSRPWAGRMGPWPSGTHWSPPWLLHGDRWAVDLWTVRPPAFPTGERWVELLRATLTGVWHHGYAVLWFGLEGDFVDPPDLFNAAMMGDGVYAAYSEPTGFICRDDGVGDLRPLHDADVARLRRVAEPVWKLVAPERGDRGPS